MADKQNNGNQNGLLARDAQARQPAPMRLPDPPACASHADRPPGMMRVTRTELVWPGKYNENGTLKDFVIPNTELIPEEVRAKVKKWSDYIDNWAVDWDFQNDTFMQGWVAFRTRKDRKLALTSDQHTYDNPGAYRILVKVIDIFGNDTSQAFDAEVPLS